MAEPLLTYIYPSWGLIPELKHRAHAVHVTAKFDEDSTLGVDIVHNFGLPFGAPLQPPEWVVPVVVVNPLSGGIAAPLHLLAAKDGNTITLGRVAGGPGSAVTYDVWIFRPGEGGSFLGNIFR